MYTITKKIKVLNTAIVNDTKFINEQIGQSATIGYSCCKCGAVNKVEIIPYVSGFSIFSLYGSRSIITKDELLKMGMLTQTSTWMLHYGELTFNDLPTLYFGTSCLNCFEKHICIFCYGEKQPGLTLLEVSGIWQYVDKS